MLTASGPRTATGARISSTRKARDRRRHRTGGANAGARMDGVENAISREDTTAARPKIDTGDNQMRHLEPYARGGLAPPRNRRHGAHTLRLCSEFRYVGCSDEPYVTG